MDRTINLHVVRNPVSHDSRVLKETATLRDSGLFSSVEIAAISAPGYIEREVIDGRPVWRIPLVTRGLPKDLASQAIKLVEWRSRIVDAYRERPVGVVHCHDLETLTIGVRLKRMTGARVVYDAHELESERSGHSRLRRLLMRITERHWMKYVDAMISVSPSIVTWYAERHPTIPIFLVRNVPPRQDASFVPGKVKARLGVPEGTLLFIYLGGLGRGRGVENMLRAFRHESVPHHLLVVGNGVLKDKVLSAVRACGRIHYLPPVPPSEVLQCTGGADVGVCLYEDTCLNHRYCLPNKLFEYLMSNLAVLASRLPDLSAVVDAFGAGWKTNNDVDSIVRALVAITPAGCASLRRGLGERTRVLGWHAEAGALLQAYERALQAA